MRNEKGIISEIIFNQKRFLELFLFVIILAIGVNFISDGIQSFFKFDSLILFFIGVGLCLISIIYAIKIVLNNQKKSVKIKAFFVYDTEKNEIVKIPFYEFSSDMYEIMNAAFVESVNLKKFWDDQPLKKSFPDLMMEESVIKTNTINFINELTEYLILAKLSKHLTDYFDNKKVLKDELKTYDRSDIPHILLENRFLELISHPINERPNFHDIADIHEEMVQVSSAGAEGALYDHFNLVLPKKSVIQKPIKNEISIESNKLKLFIKTDFHGLNIFLPPEFINDFLDISFERVLEDKIQQYLITIEIRIEMKFFSLFSRKGWEYYEWVDSFLMDLDDYLSRNTFFKNINWATVRTIQQCKPRRKSK